VKPATSKDRKLEGDHILNIGAKPPKMSVSVKLPKTSTDILKKLSTEQHKDHAALIEEALWLFDQAWTAQQSGGEVLVESDGISRSVHIVKKEN
jgi:hypothetical protein